MILKVELESGIIEFKVEYRKRKTLSIKITPPDTIVVISPIGVSEDKLKEIVKNKGKWIVKKLDELKDIDYKSLNKDFKNDETFMYLGKDYTLNIVIDKDLKDPVTKLHENNLFLYTPKRDKVIIKKALELFYREKCTERIIERVNYYKDIIGKSPRIVKVKEQKKRWGSCTSRGDIYFNWRIIMAPPNVVDYIVVHEMCHLIHLNHSKEFWNSVKTIIPNYEEYKKWLKKHGIYMDL